MPARNRQTRKPTVPAPVPAPAETNGKRNLRTSVKGFDFSTVAPTAETPESLPGSNTSSALDSTPILGWVQDSWENRTEGTRGNPPKPCEFGEVLSVPVPDAMVETTCDLLRMAAKRLGVGISIRPTKSENGATRIYFRAQTKVIGRGRPVGSKNKSK